MRTISNSEFAANPDMYFDLARLQDVRVKKGREVFHIVHETDDEEEQKELSDDEVWELFAARYPDGISTLSDEEEIARAITGEELIRRINAGLEKKWAERLK